MTRQRGRRVGWVIAALVAVGVVDGAAHSEAAVIKRRLAKIHPLQVRDDCLVLTQLSCYWPAFVEETFAFSPNGESVAYAVRSWGQRELFHGAKRMRLAGPVNTIALSPDGQRIAYTEGDRRGNQWRVIIDGTPRTAWAGGVRYLQFSPDGRHVAHVAVDYQTGVQQGNGVVIRTSRRVSEQVVLDGQPQRTHTRVNLLGFTAEGILLYHASDGDEAILVAGGEEVLRVPQQQDPVVSREFARRVDPVSMYYLANSNTTAWVNTNLHADRPGFQYGIFSADGNQAVYADRQGAVVEDLSTGATRRYQQADQGLTTAYLFNRTATDVVRRAIVADERFVVQRLGTGESTEHAWVGPMMFTDDGHLVYGAREGRDLLWVTHQ